MRAIPRAVAITVAATLALLLGGCPPWVQDTSITTIEGPPGLTRFGSSAELLDYFKREALASLQSSYSWSAGSFAGALESGNAPAMGADVASMSGSTPTTYSTTNVQEAGVDEGDVFKSDGTYFYVAKQQSLRIVRAAPLGELAEVGRVDLDGTPNAIYLFGSKAVVLATPQRGYAPRDAARTGRPNREHGFAVVAYDIDISDPTSPTITAQSEFEGRLVSSRLTNGHLILVLSTGAALPPIARGNPLRIALVGLDQVMPRMNHGTHDEPLVPPENWQRPSTPNGMGGTAVLTLDASDVTTIVGSTAVMTNTLLVYCSPEAVYLVHGPYWVADRSRQMTAIHKLSFNADGVAEYAASGEVPGRLWNQFALDEYEGRLRTATQIMDPTSSDSSTGAGQPRKHSAISILEQHDAVLEIVGQVEGIARGEDIYSSRFMGTHGFLVTYRKIDPLFVLDLSDPTAPFVAGELKVPGFSEYLHPLDDTHLIGVGRWTIPTANGFDWYQGIQLSLFDVSDWSHPQAVQQLQFGGRGSACDVLNTHKAFTFLEDQGLLAVPMQLTTLNDSPSSYGDPQFSGVLVFHVDAAAGFTELGRFADLDPIPNYIYAWGTSDWHRAAIIGDTVFCTSEAGIAGAPLNDLEHPTEIEFE